MAIPETFHPTGLTAEDFRIFDGGREEVIRSFQPAVSGLGAAASGAFDNRSGQPRVCTAILLEYFNTWFGDESFGRHFRAGTPALSRKRGEPDRDHPRLGFQPGKRIGRKNRFGHA